MSNRQEKIREKARRRVQNYRRYALRLGLDVRLFDYDTQLIVANGTHQMRIFLGWRPRKKEREIAMAANLLKRPLIIHFSTVDGRRPATEYGRA